MKILIHDLPRNANEILFAGKFDHFIMYADNGAVHRCIGCINCGQPEDALCCFHDVATSLAEDFEECEELVIISRCVYGSVSTFIKTMIDRTRGAMLPTLEVRGGDVMYKTKKRAMKLRVCFYNAKNKRYEETAKRFVHLLAQEWNTSDVSVEFYEDQFQIGGSV